MPKRKFLPLALYQAKANLYNLRQGQMSNHDYLQRFNNLVDVAITYNGQLHDQAIVDIATEKLHPGTEYVIQLYNGGTHTLGDELLFANTPGTPTVTPGAPGNGTISVTGNALITYNNVEKVPSTAIKGHQGIWVVNDSSRASRPMP